MHGQRARYRRPHQAQEYLLRQLAVFVIELGRAVNAFRRHFDRTLAAADLVIRLPGNVIAFPLIPKLEEHELQQSQRGRIAEEIVDEGVDQSFLKAQSDRLGWLLDHRAQFPRFERRNELGRAFLGQPAFAQPLRHEGGGFQPPNQDRAARLSRRTQPFCECGN